MAVWNDFMKSWVFKYVVFPDTVARDQGPQFTSIEWRKMRQKAGVLEQAYGVENHNKIGLGERYYSYLDLRKVYENIAAKEPFMESGIVFELAIKAIDDKVGPNSLLPTLLLFGIVQRVPLTTKDIPELTARMKGLSEACKEMTKISNSAWLATSLRYNVPAAADIVYKNGDEVVMYR